MADPTSAQPHTPGPLAPIATIGAAGLRHHLGALTAHGPRDADSTAAIAATLRHITDSLTGWGYRVVVERYGGDLADVNLLAELPGAEPHAAILEVGAHWDTVPGSPGADDNASGVAGALEAARALSLLGRAQRGIRFCFFGGEEDGFLGSTAHLDRLDPNGAAVQGALVFEMIGYRTSQPGTQRVPAAMAGLIDPPTRGDFIAVVTDEHSADYATAFALSALSHAPELGILAVTAPAELLNTVSRSDHVPYWRSGRKALLVTDTAEYRNPHYHRPTDTTDTLDLEFAADVTRTVTAAAAHLAGHP